MFYVFRFIEFSKHVFVNNLDSVFQNCFRIMCLVKSWNFENNIFVFPLYPSFWILNFEFWILNFKEKQYGML